MTVALAFMNSRCLSNFHPINSRLVSFPSFLCICNKYRVYYSEFVFKYLKNILPQAQTSHELNMKLSMKRNRARHRHLCCPHLHYKLTISERECVHMQCTLICVVTILHGHLKLKRTTRIRFLHSIYFLLREKVHT